MEYPVCSVVSYFVTSCTVAHQAPLFLGCSRQGYHSVLTFPSPGESSRPRDRTLVSCTAGRFFYHLSQKPQYDSSPYKWGSLNMDICRVKSCKDKVRT